MQTNNNQKIFRFLIILLLVNVILLIIILVKFWVSNRIQETPEMKKHKSCLLEELQLSDQQKELFISLRNEHYRKMEELFDMHRQTRMELINYIESHPEATPEDVRWYADSLGKIETQIQVQAIDYFLSVRQILDAEQYGKFLNRFRKMSGCGSMGHKHHCKKKIVKP